MKEPVFTGCAAALVTPFKDGEVDFPALGRLIELQIAGGCAAVVVCATTGESAVLSYPEHKAIVGEAVRCARRVRPSHARCGGRRAHTRMT